MRNHNNIWGIYLMVFPPDIVMINTPDIVMINTPDIVMINTLYT